MSNEDRAPLIRLEIDQEVFIDTVRESDVIEDATVATEVTSFDKVGDAYVLEGALVFAGYVKNNTDNGEDDTITAGTDVLSFGTDADEFVRHIHQRLPFVLRVPQRTQPRGIVNVASRISSWSLDVTGAGWVRVVADLSIVGLVGDHGYHFQCGAQEEGNVFFGDSASHVQAADPVAEQEQSLSADTGTETDALFVSAPEAEVDLQLTAGEAEQQESFSVLSTDDLVSHTTHSDVDDISLARGGFEDAHEGDGDARYNLAAFDRALEGNGFEQAQENHTSDGKQADQPDQPVAEFEFVHQVPTSELKTPIPQDHRSEEEFVASRSFSEQGFKPTEGFVPYPQKERYEGDSGLSNKDCTDLDVHEHENRQSDSYDLADGIREEEPVVGAEVTIRSEGSTDDTDKLWSFVDFHAPETYYTMRFIVVMEEETVESVSERIGCPRTELVRVNRLVGENIYAGQTLLVPNQKMNWSR